MNNIKCNKNKEKCEKTELLEIMLNNKCYFRPKKIVIKIFNLRILIKNIEIVQAFLSYVITNVILAYSTLFMFHDSKININTEQKD